MLVPNGVRMRKHRMGEVGITLERAPPGPEMLKKYPFVPGWFENPSSMDVLWKVLMIVCLTILVSSIFFL